MKPYLEQIKDLIKEPYEKKDERFDSVQDLLWYYYTMHHPVDTDTLREKMIELEPIIRPLSEKNIFATGYLNCVLNMSVRRFYPGCKWGRC